MSSRRSRAPVARTATADSTASPQTPEASVAVTTTKSRSKRKLVPIAPDADQVLRKCRQLKDAIRAQKEDYGCGGNGINNNTQALPDGIPQDIIEVTDLSSSQVLEGMEAVALRIAKDVLNKKGFVLDIPSRASSNQIYVKEWDRIVLGGKRSTRTFLNVKEARKSAITLRGGLSSVSTWY